MRPPPIIAICRECAQRLRAWMPATTAPDYRAGICCVCELGKTVVTADQYNFPRREIPDVEKARRLRQKARYDLEALFEGRSH